MHRDEARKRRGKSGYISESRLPAAGVSPTAREKRLVFGGADPILAGALGLIERTVGPGHGGFEILA